MSKDTFYFSHDYNTRADDKIKGLIRKHGITGYGVFWAIVEDLYNNANALHLDYEGIAYDLRVDSEMVKSIINDFDLFCFEDGSFGSSSIEKRLDERNSKSEKARQSAFNRWDKIRDNANAMRTHSECNAIKERKGKDNKGKERIIKSIFTPPLLSDVELYFEENGYKKEVAKKMFNSYSVANWVDSKGNPVKNWKQKAINVWFKDENKIVINNDDLEYKQLKEKLYGKQPV